MNAIRVRNLCLVISAILAPMVVAIETPYFIRKSFEWTPPMPLNARQLIEHPAYIPIPPMTVTLRFVDPKEFYAKFDPHITGMTIYGPGNVGCTVAVPANGLIETWADHGFAVFAEANTGPNLAHEILHCIAGLWHRSWSDINASHAHSVTAYYAVNDVPFDGRTELDPRDMR